MEKANKKQKPGEEPGIRPGPDTEGGKLAIVNAQVGGIDIGSRRMHVCGPVGGDREVREYDTTTEKVRNCARWLRENGVQSVAMESTGVYWIPVLEILESEGLETLLVDTRPLSRVPGRKSDVLDCQWIQTLHSHGLLKGSFRPQQAISELRAVVRQKAVLVREQADWVRRMHKCLDQMNVRVHHAVSDTQGATGMAIIRAIVGGERNPEKLAQLRDPRCQKSGPHMAALLNGNWRADHLFNLQQSLKMYDEIGARIADYEREIERRMQALTPPGRAQQPAPPLANAEKHRAIKRRKQEEKRQNQYRFAGVDMTTVDGVGVETVEVVLSEYGTDLEKFSTEKQFVAHAQLAPRYQVSGGKPLPKSRRKGKGTRTAEALRRAAISVRHSRSALGAYYRRIAARLGSQVAVFATARKIGIWIFRMLRWGQPYVDIGQDAYEQQYKAVKLRNLQSTARQLGYELIKTEAPVSA